jgi:hypothetical protein
LDRYYYFKNIFAEKNGEKLELNAKFLIMTLDFKKNAIFAENWQKSQKIGIITLTPDEFVKK